MKSWAWAKKGVLFAVLVIAIAMAGLFYVSTMSSPKIRNVVLISMDTTRADHLSCYGVYKNVTPNIDALAKEAVLFKNTYSPIPLTLPAHSSMMTGRIPPAHGIHDNLKYQLNDKNLTLAEILKDNDFITVAVISAFILDSRFGLEQGFDTYDDSFDEELENSNISQRRGGETTEHAIRWLQKNKDNPFFLFVHYYDPHMPYDPPEPFKSRILHPYFAEIAYTDHCIGQVINELKALDLYDSTLIVITGDHGEMLGEHQEMTHGYYIYQANIKVPLIFKVPGETKSKIVDDIAGLVDITPTVCSLLGVDIPEHIQGKDLSSYIVGGKVTGAEKRHLYCECMVPTKYGANSLLGIVTDRFKYIQTTRPELYDVINDSKESENLIAQQPQQARILQDKLKQILEDSVSEEPESDLELDTEAVQKLEALGYVGSAVEEEFSFAQNKKDPKDLIGYHTDMSKIQGLIQSEEFDTAEQVCEELIAQNITETYGQLCHFMIAIAKKKNDYQKAITYIQKVIELNPEQPSAYIEYGRALLELGKIGQASVQLHTAHQFSPENAVISGNIAKAFYDGGRLNEAIDFCYKALESNPDYILVRTSLADTLLKNNQAELAVKQYYEVLRGEPDNLEALNALAWIQATSNDDTLSNPEESLRLALHCCQIADYQGPELLDTLAAAYAANLQFAEAVKMAEKALQSAREQGLDELAGRMGVRLKRYEASQRQ